MNLSDEECKQLIANKDYDRIFQFMDTQPNPGYDIQFIHQFILIIICGCSCLLNGILFYLILTQSRSLKSIKQVIMFSCVYDFFFSLYSIQIGSLPGSVVGVVFAYDNQLIRFSNYHVMAVLKTVNGMALVGTWMIIPIQFLWRYHIFRYGQAPQGLYLYFTLIPSILIYLFGACVMFSIWGYATEEDRMLMRKIVHYNGFRDVQMSEVTGTFSSSLNYAVYDYMVKGILTTSYSISIVVDWLMSKHWKLRNINANYRTAKTFSGVKKALRIMAVGPLITAILPTYLIRMFGSACSFHPWAIVASSWLIVTQSLLNAITTIYFIQPYRRFFFKLKAKNTSTNVEVIEVSGRTHTK